MRYHTELVRAGAQTSATAGTDGGAGLNKGAKGLCSPACETRGAACRVACARCGGLGKDLQGLCRRACETRRVACRVACARYGGPIAMVRDDRKLVVVQGAATKPVVRVFTAAGRALAAFMWDRGRVAGMGWSNQEDLLIVEDTGQVFCTALESVTSWGWHSWLLPAAMQL